MIVVDTSALIAILLNEPDSDACIAALENETDMLVSAGTVAEALIVSARRNIGVEMESLIASLELSIESVTHADARKTASAYAKWGKGVHPAGLNFGDCFAYALAKQKACPLLYVGDDFSKTDVVSALAPR